MTVKGARIVIINCIRQVRPLSDDGRILLYVCAVGAYSLDNDSRWTTATINAFRCDFNKIYCNNKNDNNMDYGYASEYNIYRCVYISYILLYIYDIINRRTPATADVPN